MRVNRKPRWRAGLLCAAILVTSSIVVTGTQTAAQAAPGCQDVSIVFARGSVFPDTAPGLSPWTGETNAFFTKVNAALGKAGYFGNVVQLGDKNGDGALDADGYPAVGGTNWLAFQLNDGTWQYPGYSQSVVIGTNELVNYLNARAIQCPNEAEVAGGFSQGADLLGWALQRNGSDGYPSLTPAARKHIAYAALYGDPKFDAGNPYDRQSGIVPWWVQGNSPGYADIEGMPAGQSGLLGARNPYAPSEFQGRFGSWCDQYDSVCNGTANIGGSHTTTYTSYWINQSAGKIADAARAKIAELNPPPLPPAPPPATTGPDLFFIKTRNTGSGRVEVHTAIPQMGYGDGWHAVTRFGTNEQNNGWFQMVGNDLWYIKTKNTGSGRVELHSATAASGYRSGEDIATYISTNDQDNGWFQMVGTELFFIKTKHTGDGHVEVHSATRASGYQSGQHNATWMPASDNSNGWFQMLGADLFFVKTKNTGSGRVEMHVAWASTNYQGADHSVTRFGSNEQDNGWFQIIHRDLWFIKTRNTGSGRVEIHSATEASGFTAGQSNATWMSPLDQSNGWFQVGVK